MSGYCDPEVARYYHEQERLSRRSERRAKESFFTRLRQVGLGWLVGRLLNLGWHAIRAALGF
jgi:hypothetical protein